MNGKIKVVTPTMKVNDDLFYKMRENFETFVEKTGLLPPGEQEDKEYEIATKKEMLKFMEANDISGVAAIGLLTLDYPLDYLYATYRLFFSIERFNRFIEEQGRILYNSFKRN